MYIIIISFAVSFGTITSDVKDRFWTSCNHNEQEKQANLKDNASHAISNNKEYLICYVVLMNEVVI